MFVNLIAIAQPENKMKSMQQNKIKYSYRLFKLRFFWPVDCATLMTWKRQYGAMVESRRNRKTTTGKLMKNSSVLEFNDKFQLIHSSLQWNVISFESINQSFYWKNKFDRYIGRLQHLIKTATKIVISL